MKMEGREGIEEREGERRVEDEREGRALRGEEGGRWKIGD